MAGVIRVLPAGVEFDVADGESVFEAATRHGVRWPSICQGDMECGICWMAVHEGAENVSVQSKAELDRLAQGLKAGDPTVRLACQSRLCGPVAVVRKGVRRRV